MSDFLFVSCNSEIPQVPRNLEGFSTQPLSKWCFLLFRETPPDVKSSIEEVYASSHPAYTYSADASELVIGTDNINQRLVYYTQTDSQTIASSSCELLQQYMQSPSQLSPTALSGWLAGQPVNDLCLFEDIHVVPAGYALHCGPKKTHLKKYWDIDPAHQVRFNTDAEYADHFRMLLHKAVSKNVHGQDVFATQMSGGMDSTSITALAQDIAMQRGDQCYTLSHYYKHDERSDESSLIQAMRDHLQLGNFLYQHVDEARYQNFLNLYPPHFDNPGIVLSPRYDDELSMLNTRQASVLLTGNGGDEVCWGHASAYTQRFKQGELSVIPEVYRACKQTNIAFPRVAYHLFAKPLIPNHLIKLANWLRRRQKQSVSLPKWLTPNAKQLALSSYQHHNPFNERSMPVHHARYFALKNSTTFNSVRSYDAMAKRHRIRVEHPFFDKDLIDFSFAIPVKQLIRGAYPKWVLRNAMQDRLPESVCWRATKTVFDTHFASLVRNNAEQLRQCLSHPMLADMGLIDINKVLKAFDNAVSHQGNGMQVDLLFVILTQRWIQEFHAN